MENLCVHLISADSVWALFWEGKGVNLFLVRQTTCTAMFWILLANACFDPGASNSWKISMQDILCGGAAEVIMEVTQPVTASQYVLVLYCEWELLQPPLCGGVGRLSTSTGEESCWTDGTVLAVWQAVCPSVEEMCWCCRGGGGGGEGEIAYFETSICKTFHSINVTGSQFITASTHPLYRAKWVVSGFSAMCMVHWWSHS